MGLTLVQLDFFWLTTRLSGLALVAAFFVFVSGCQRIASSPEAVSFDLVTLDQHGPVAPWGKAVGDLNGDGRPDLIVGGREGRGLVWYENPGWQKHVIASEGAFGTGLEVGDIDKDGRNDVVSLMDDRLVWFRNVGVGQWEMKEIDRQRLHDVQLADLGGGYRRGW